MKNKRPAPYYGTNHPLNKTQKSGQQSSRSSAKSMPLLLMAGILIVFGVALQIVRLTVFEQDAFVDSDTTIQREFKRKTLEVPVDKTIDDSLTVFETLHEKYPDYKRNPKKEDEGLVVPPIKKKVVYLSHNPVWGRFDAPIDISLFVDHACDPCRARLNGFLRQLQPYKNDVRVIMKYAPTAEKSDAAGIFSQMAQREGVFKPYLQNVLSAKALQDEDLFLLLEKSGVPIAKQRNMMRDDLKSISKNIQMDINQFKELEGTDINKDGFVVYLNGYKLDTAGLYISEIATYISRLKNGDNMITGE